MTEKKDQITCDIDKSHVTTPNNSDTLYLQLKSFKVLLDFPEPISSHTNTDEKISVSNDNCFQTVPDDLILTDLANKTRVYTEKPTTNQNEQEKQLNYKRAEVSSLKATKISLSILTVSLSLLIPLFLAFLFKDELFGSDSLSTIPIFNFFNSINNITMAPHSEVESTATTTTTKAPGPLSPSLQVPEGFEVATFAGGCFWGVERVFRQHHANSTTSNSDIDVTPTKGLYGTRVGYCGGPDSSVNPTYKQVCTNTTGHAESVQLVYDPSILSYETLVDFFFRIHDPTTPNQQGPDNVGEQYRSIIFTHNDKQREIAERVKEKYQKEWFDPVNRTISTEITPISVFWDAEDYHQQYLENNPTGYQCPSHFLRTSPPKGPEVYKKKNEK